MRRALLTLVLAVGCGGAPADKPCPCAADEACVFTQGRTTASCKKLCGTCAGATCTCGSSCAGCKDCVSVCQ